MKVRFIGDDNDPKTKEMGIQKNGVYRDVALTKASHFRALQGHKLILKIKVLGRALAIPYGSMEAFDRNWEIL